MVDYLRRDIPPLILIFFRHKHDKPHVWLEIYRPYGEEEFDDIKVVIRIRIWKKNRQFNGQKKKRQNDKQRSTKHCTKKLEIEQHDPSGNCPVLHSIPRLIIII